MLDRRPVVRLQAYIEAAGFKGYDPYDALNSPVLRFLSFRRKFLRIAFIQLLKRLPVNLRPLLLVKKDYNPVHLLPPLPYNFFLKLYKDASLVLTDSGGLQEETTALGIPCFTIRENTERPVTIEEGTNTLVGTSAEGILSEFEKFKRGETKKGRVPELWDGKASERIVDILLGQKR
jgi:UDP-N-acetylglucosamine 2-epimerase